jgi:hypothetical protein
VRLEEIELVADDTERPVEFDQLVTQWASLSPSDLKVAAETVTQATSRAGYADVQTALDQSGLVVVDPGALIGAMHEREALDEEDTQALEAVPPVSVAEVHHDHYADLDPDNLDREYATGQIPKVQAHDDPPTEVIMNEQPTRTLDPTLYMTAPEEEE